MTCPLIASLITEFPFVLASSSPRRRRVLEGLDLEFTIEPPGVDESALPGEAPEDHVVRLARLKARTVAVGHSAGTVLGADTTVLLDGALLGKPSDAADAVRMLRSIRGRWHEVLTGVAVVRCTDGECAADFERTRVLVRELTDSQIEDYVACGEPLDKAGSYGIQECGAALVERVDGCFYNVVGLPVVRLSSVLEDLGAVG